MLQEPSSQKTKVCPTCGTRLSENATRCLVCGTELTAKAATKSKKAETIVQASRMPEITLSLPAALGALVTILLIGAAVVYFLLQSGFTGTTLTEPTIEVTPSETGTITPTATEISTQTPIPTETPLPPFDYTVRDGDTCGGIAVAFEVSVQSIVILNNLPTTCIISVNQVLKIPYPTPTPAPPPTEIPNEATQTAEACEKVPYTVQSNDTLSSISLNYNVPQDAIKFYNGLSTDNVFIGQTLLIPLCARFATPGPTPTATLPPPYPAANLLLPADGAAFTLANDVVTLQWASIGTLRENEAYQVTIEDVTSGQGRRLTDYVTDTKFIVPTSFRPSDNLAHVIRWWVTTVRQSGVDEQGQPIYNSAGAVSEERVFTWVGVAVEGTPTP
ncbi:MAG: LysM peptidoglycan-binding domain-containing protein [Anaerolineae bacterium]|nr:LysM peptidoglycan-binding domain-containing protein [Anaerolineae bacterium]MCI0608191.1 LysM peptidoglycan-binding domain-containing protein [Anaerolineae bacterium]